MPDRYPENIARAAKLAHSMAARAAEEAKQYREQRDDLIIELRVKDGWSYGQIAEAVGVTRSFIALICRPVRGQRTPPTS